MGIIVSQYNSDVYMFYIFWCFNSLSKVYKPVYENVFTILLEDQKLKDSKQSQIGTERRQ